jgi:hypothetical protein
LRRSAPKRPIEDADSRFGQCDLPLELASSLIVRFVRKLRAKPFELTPLQGLGHIPSTRRETLNPSYDGDPDHQMRELI